MKPVFFADQYEFRKWLEENHDKEDELIVGFIKVNIPGFNMTWSESVDQALCFGWIDGIRRSIDEKRYCIRFTPRKPTSIWSKINIKKVEELTAKGLMRPSGIEAFGKMNPAKSSLYSFESEQKILPAAFESRFRAVNEAWTFFESQPPSYKKMMIHWVLSPKREETQLRRLEKLISESSNSRRINFRSL
jgi:uncharacterized protein YdeI (YjbR/CyaY-like superfamily)